MSQLGLMAKYTQLLATIAFSSVAYLAQADDLRDVVAHLSKATVTVRAKVSDGSISSGSGF